jgi:hypothetical protein
MRPHAHAPLSFLVKNVDNNIYTIHDKVHQPDAWTWLHIQTLLEQSSTLLLISIAYKYGPNLLPPKSTGSKQRSIYCLQLEVVSASPPSSPISLSMSMHTFNVMFCPSSFIRCQCLNLLLISWALLLLPCSLALLLLNEFAVTEGIAELLWTWAHQLTLRHAMLPRRSGLNLWAAQLR